MKVVSSLRITLRLVESFPHLIDVGARRLAYIGILVPERNSYLEHRVGRVLGELGADRIRDD
jgi:hypothetical protein